MYRSILASISILFALGCGQKNAENLEDPKKGVEPTSNTSGAELGLAVQAVIDACAVKIRLDHYDPDAQFEIEKTIAAAHASLPKPLQDRFCLLNEIHIYQANPLDSSIAHFSGTSIGSHSVSIGDFIFRDRWTKQTYYEIRYILRVLGKQSSELADRIAFSSSGTIDPHVAFVAYVLAHEIGHTYPIITSIQGPDVCRANALYHEGKRYEHELVFPCIATSSCPQTFMSEDELKNGIRRWYAGKAPSIYGANALEEIPEWIAQSLYFEVFDIEETITLDGDALDLRRRHNSDRLSMYRNCTQETLTRAPWLDFR